MSNRFRRLGNFIYYGVLLTLILFLTTQCSSKNEEEQEEVAAESLVSDQTTPAIEEFPPLPPAPNGGIEGECLDSSSLIVQVRTPRLPDGRCPSANGVQPRLQNESFRFPMARSIAESRPQGNHCEYPQFTLNHLDTEDSYELVINLFGKDYFIREVDFDDSTCEAAKTIGVNFR